MTNLVILFVFGAIVGSFLNVVGLRWNSGLTMGGRSFCPVCMKKLRFWELVPIVSYVALRGRCARCKTRISPQYPLVELLTGLVFATVLPWMLPVFCIYIAILIYDFRHKIIPDAFVYTAIVLSLIYCLFLTPHHLLDLLSGPIIFSFFGLVWLLSKGRAMGFGDAKLGLSVGLLLGFAQGLSAIVLSFWIGSGVTLLYMLGVRLFGGSKKLTMKSEVPFAPFIILGAWLALIFHFDLLHVALI